MSSRARHALIIGGSMSGLFAGLYLRRRGWDVDIFERSPAALTGRGAGIMTHPAMRRALGELGIDTSRDFGVPIEHRLVLDRAGSIVAQRYCPQTATSWNRLFEMLTAAFGRQHYHLGKDLRRVSQTSDGVSAHFCRRYVARRRPADRRRRFPLERAGAAPARGATALCRLRRLARPRR